MGKFGLQSETSNRRAFLLAGGFAAIYLAMLPGCLQSLDTLARKNDEPEKDRYEIRILGEVCSIGNPEPIPLELDW